MGAFARLKRGGLSRVAVRGLPWPRPRAPSRRFAAPETSDGRQAIQQHPTPHVGALFGAVSAVFWPRCASDKDRNISRSNPYTNQIPEYSHARWSALNLQEGAHSL
jgi:hypothetical protein